jgi:outer membrane protein assembly factor BamB
MRITLVLFLVGCGSSGVRHGSDGGSGKDGFEINFDIGGVMVCSPSDPPTCADGMTVQTCRFDGSGYDYTPCTASCMNGACTCNPGDTMCNGQDVMKCDNTGVYQKVETCPQGSQCANGMCADPRCGDETMSTNPHALPVNAWPRFRHDNRNTGSTPTVVADNPKLKWKTHIGGTSMSAGAMAGGPVVNQQNFIFIVGGEMDGMNGAYHQLDPKGNILWTFNGQAGWGISTPAVRADGVSYFASETGELYAIDPMGKQAWQFGVPANADANPIVTHDGTLIYGDDDLKLYALDATGKVLWTSDPNNGPGQVDSGIAEGCDGTIYAGGDRWAALDSKTGNTLWTIPATGPVRAICSSPLVDVDGTVYGVDSAGLVFSADKTGKVLWMNNLGVMGAAGSLAKVGNEIVFVLNDGNLYALDATKGTVSWKKPIGNGTSGELLAGPVVDGKHRIYFGSNDGNLYSFDAAGNQLWKIPHSGVVVPNDNWAGNLAIGNDGTIYVPGNDGNLYAFQ